MIEGIEVLNKVPIMEPYRNSLGEIAALLFAIFFIVTLVLFANGLDFLIAGISAIITIILLATSILLYELQKETGRYEYQCIISDEVLFVDMYEKYEVVSKNGELWTIRDKEELNYGQQED